MNAGCRVDSLPRMEDREVNGNPDRLRAFRAEGRSASSQVDSQEISLEVSKPHHEIIVFW